MDHGFEALRGVGANLTEPAIEKHYRVKELCSILGLSDRSVRRLIASEADVVVLPEKKALQAGLPDEFGARIRRAPDTHPA